MNINTLIGSGSRSSSPTGRRRQVIAERTYNGYQPPRFVRICRYVIAEGIPSGGVGDETSVTGQNSLLLELENRLEVTLSAVRVRVTQLDAEGNAVGETEHTFGGLRAEPGALFVPREAIFLCAACTAVTVQVQYADAGRYRYRMVGDTPEVELASAEAARVPKGWGLFGATHIATVRDKAQRGYRLMNLVAIMVAVILLVLCVYSVLYEQVGKAMEDFLRDELWGGIRRFFTESIPSLFR